MRVPLAVPNLAGREAEYLQECVRSTFVSTAGPFVNRLEEEVAKISGVAQATATCTGTVALQVALEAAGVQAGDLVMAPSLTFIATPNSVRHARADVWLVDCRADDWTFDLELARESVLAHTEAHQRGRLHMDTGKVLSALMPVMTMGANLDLEAYVDFAREFGLKLVIDAAAAIGGSSVSGRPLALPGVDAVCYSFNGNKTVTCGGGGAVASHDAELIDRVRHLITTGRTGASYDHDIVAYNFRMTNVEAAIGVAQLERLGSFLDRKRQIQEAYANLAAGVPALEPFPEPAGGSSTHWFSGCWYTGNDLSVVEEFRAHMVDAGVDVRSFWKPVHLQGPYLQSLKTATDVTDDLWERILPLPCSTGLTNDDLEFVVSTASDFWAGRG